MSDSPDGPFLADAALVRAAQGGDTLALNELLDRLSPYVARICGPIALASGPDAAQDALIAVLRGLPKLREPAALRGWARAIAVRARPRPSRADAGPGPARRPARGSCSCAPLLSEEASCPMQP